MTLASIDKIKAEIVRLSYADFAALREWMIEHAHDRWDAQIASDDALGLLDDLKAEARVEASTREGRE